MFRLARRVYNLLDERREDDRTFVLAAHKGIVRFVKSWYQDLTNEEFAAYKVRNCEIYRFE